MNQQPSSTRHYRLLNVFTQGGRPLSGNALCVFEDGLGLDDATMQALARQFNLSETTFLLPSSVASARVRIFTPSYELPFAGHPTLGTASVCRALGLAQDVLSLEMKAGIVQVSAQGQRWTLCAPAPSWREPELSRAHLARLLGLTEADVLERPLWVRTGSEQLIVPLASEGAVRRAVVQRAAFDELRSTDGAAMAYVFALASEQRAIARFFFPQGTSVLEDPATGSACANLGGCWLAMGGALPCELVISQGEQIGRSSSLYLNIELDRQIRVGGEVIELGRGSLVQF
jgi:trans-2,3-dihydro-3-hydroxyanthranilate isomerase